MIDSYAVAMQGIGFSPMLVAVQGFGPIEVTQLPSVAGVASVSGSGKASKARRLPDWLDNQGKLAKLHQDDQVVTELLVSLVTKGFFHDCQELRTKL
jgi:hypothetical protein